MEAADNPAYRDVVDALAADPDVSEAKMMGMPSVKLESKMFLGLFEDDLIAKIGRERVDELVATGRGKVFDPSRRGRGMKDWLQATPGDDWLALAEEAKRFIAE